MFCRVHQESMDSKAWADKGSERDGEQEVTKRRRDIYEANDDRIPRTSMLWITRGQENIHGETVKPWPCDRRWLYWNCFLLSSCVLLTFLCEYLDTYNKVAPPKRRSQGAATQKQEREKPAPPNWGEGRKNTTTQTEDGTTHKEEEHGSTTRKTE